jgi:hypothetical protein
MQMIRIWGLRLIAVVLAAFGAGLAVTATKSDWSSLRFVERPIDHPGVLAAALAAFMILCAIAALAASSPKRSAREQMTLVGSVIALVSIGVLFFQRAHGGT